MSSVISLPVKITKAVEADIPALAEINTFSYLPEAICPFFIPGWPNPAPFISFFTARATYNIEDPNTEVFKIVDEGSDEILGFVGMVRSDGKEKESRHGSESNPGGNFEPPANSGFNLEFGMHSAQGLAKLEEFMKGKEHYVLTSLAVHPKHQSRGLGSKLLQHCAEVADASRLPTYLNAFPGAHSLYWRFGFEDVEHFDVDLNEWGTKHRGFGIYRTYGMLRQPNAKVK